MGLVNGVKDYSDLFEEKINQILSEEHPEKQVRVVVQIYEQEMMEKEKIDYLCTS